MRKSALLVGVGGFLIAGFALGLIRELGASKKLRAELATLRRQRIELASLRGENQELSAGQISAGELGRLFREHAEADRLRRQIEFLKTPVPPSVALEVAYGKVMAASDWKFAGQKTPQAAFESVLWAATHQDVDHLAGLLAFDAQTRPKVEAFFAQLPADIQAQYGSPEKLAATMLAANLPPDLSAAAPVGEAAQGSELFMQLQRSDGTKKVTSYAFQSGNDGWKLIVPPKVLADYEAELTDSSFSVPQALANGQKP